MPGGCGSLNPRVGGLCAAGYGPPAFGFPNSCVNDARAVALGADVIGWTQEPQPERFAVAYSCTLTMCPV